MKTISNWAGPRWKWDGPVYLLGRLPIGRLPMLKLNFQAVKIIGYSFSPEEKQCEEDTHKIRK